MDKLDLQTPDFTSANIARILELLPNCRTETKQPDGTLKSAIDFDLLRQELSHDIVEGPQERYRLDWPGKREALALANAPIRKTLRPCKDESVDFNTTQNLYIEGDNLDALKLLQETYLGKVKMIYIDPPYNTGSDFIYDDDFSISREEYEESSGEKDEEGNAMFDEEKWKLNSSANGRFHSEWLSMMYPRLKLARNLLREDGLIFVSLDDHEVSSCRKIADEVFGSNNFLCVFAWLKRYSVPPDTKDVGYQHENIVCYRRSELACLNNLPLSEDQVSRYVNRDSDPRGPWKAMDYTCRYTSDERPNLYYPIPNLITGIEVWPKKTRVWAMSKAVTEKNIAENRIWWGEDGGNAVPALKNFLTEIKQGRTPSSFLHYDEVGHTDEAAKELRLLLPEIKFTPKPTRLIQHMLLLAAGRDDLILDFFSGSATTAHAVMQLNAEDGGKRRHIMVQIPEPCADKSEAFKAGCTTIAEIGKERIRRAGKKVLEEWQAKQASAQCDLLNPPSPISDPPSPPSPPDIGFRVLKIDSSNMADVYYQPDELSQDALALHVDNLKLGRNSEDLLFQVLLDWGVDLALPITEEKILKRRVFFVAENALAACFDTGLDEAFVKELAKRQPLRAVFRDSGYASDAVKINFEQIFKALSPHTEIKTL